MGKNFLEASSRTRQKNALENMQHSFSMTDLECLASCGLVTRQPSAKHFFKMLYCSFLMKTHGCSLPAHKESLKICF